LITPFVSSKHFFNYVDFQSIDFERIWWRLFQKRFWLSLWYLQTFVLLQTALNSTSTKLIHIP
jgi:hypothetical protein